MIDRKTIIKFQKNLTDCAIWFGEENLQQFSVGIPTKEKDIVICDESSGIILCVTLVPQKFISRRKISLLLKSL